MKQVKRRRRRVVKALLITTGVLALIVLGLHIWFVNNARNLIKDIVATKSHGKLKLELNHISFNFLTNKLQVKEAKLLSTDSLTQPTSYRLRFNQLTLQTGSFWSLLFHRRLSLDSIHLTDPEITVTQWKKDTSVTKARDELSISKEMGKMYNSMLDGLEAFGIRRIEITNARINLINKMKPDVEPVTISNINFNLIRTAENARKRDEYVENEQTVDLQTTNQDIALPGGRHRLSFRTFNLQLFNKRIELDSCTVTAIAKDSMKSSYTIFFNKLLLVGVDFDAMYRYNLIKADSVYCENPLFDINLSTGKPTAKKKERPDPNQIIQELTGDLDLAFVGVKDAGIHINISGRKRRSLFNSNKDDFEMRGLRINSDSSQPVVVERFDMLVRDYHLYNEDSSAAYSFDSIHFLNNKIVLNNFTVLTSDKLKTKSDRDFRIPYFELSGLDWYQLIFEENLFAREAVLYDPVINYTRRVSGPRKKTNIFRSLQTLDDLITLNKVSVINGTINMNLGNATSLNIQDANLSLYSDRLLSSTNNEGLRKAIDVLSFSNALIRLGSITAEIQNARYTGTNLVHADRVIVNGRSNSIKALINDVYIDNLLVNESTETILLDGLRWKNAKLQLSPAKGKTAKNQKGTLHLKNISGNNTEFRFVNGKNTISSFVQSVKIASVMKNGKGDLQLQGLAVAGRNLAIDGKDMNIRSASYLVADNAPSYLNSVQVNQAKGQDSLSLKASRIDFSPDINAILAKDFHLNSLGLSGAVIRMNKWADSSTQNTTAKPSIRIDRLDASEPDIHVALHKNDSVTVIHIPKSDQSAVKATGLVVNADGTRVGSLSIYSNSATLTKPTGEIIGVENGKVEVDVSNLNLSQKDGKQSWSVLINKLQLQNPNSFTLGKNRNALQFSQASVGNLNLSSEYINNFDKLLRFNLSAWLRGTTGQYVDSTTSLKWYNAEYNSAKKQLSLDSFEYHPTQSRDSVIMNSPFQTDYITLRTGAINISDFNLDKYEKDSSIIANTMQIVNPVITVYRDKKPPFQSGIVKPLPVDMIRKITLPVSVQKMKLVDGLLTYTERNAKTRAEGTLSLTHLDAELSNIKNRRLEDDDSLSLYAKGYLMDSAEIRLRVKESYADSLSGFLMALQLKPTTLSFLNPVIVPLSNVKITSGTIDSFQVRAIGHDKLSIGEMKMYYHGLRIKLVKNGEENKSSLLTKFASFIANTFIIKKNNNGRTGIIYFERLRDRSFFNYIVKMTFSGMATSIGVKKNRKYMKQYKRELKKRNLPPIQFE